MRLSSGLVTSVDAILSARPLAGLTRVTDGGGGREVTGVRLAERFADLEAAPAGSLVILGRALSDLATDYRFDMALRWAALGGVSAVAAFAERRWQPPATAMDIAGRAGLDPGTGRADRPAAGRPRRGRRRAGGRPGPGERGHRRGGPGRGLRRGAG